MSFHISPPEYLTKLYTELSSLGDGVFRTLPLGFIVIFIFFMNDTMIGNFTAKGYYLLGFLFQFTVFFSVSHLLFQDDSIMNTSLPFQFHNSLSFSSYMVAYTLTYWYMMNLFQNADNSLYLILYYLVFYILFFTYLSLIPDTPSFVYLFGSAIFGLLSGIGWALVVRPNISFSSVADSESSSSRGSSPSIIDLTNQKDMTCTAFRL